MSVQAESVVLCEGVHDRAFWKGWLEHLGCRDARPPLPAGGLGKAVDPFGKAVEQGQFAFLTRTGAFVRVRPCNGDNGVRAMLKRRLGERTTNALSRLVVSIDVDITAHATDTTGATSQMANLRKGIADRVATLALPSTVTTDGDISLDGGATLVSAVLWWAEDLATPELPAQQTLERLVCASLRAAYPDRARAVAAWLASRPSPPAESPKDHAWSHMAGWYANHNCDDFYQTIWRDPAVVAQLEARLHPSGARRIAEALAG